MFLAKIGVKRPVATLMLFLAIFLAGSVAFYKLPLDLLPEVEMPTITVMTVYPGADAKTIEEEVTKKLESYLATVSNLEEIKSISKDNVSFITLKFSTDEEITTAENNVRTALEFAKPNLPSGIKSPVIYRLDMSQSPILEYAIISLDSNNVGLKKYVEDNIADELKKVKGVGTVLTIGGKEREIQIKLDRNKLEAYNISFDQISNILKMENLNIPAGDIKTGDLDFAIRIPGRITSLDDIKNIPITSFGGEVVYLKDIADIQDTIEKSDVYTAEGYNDAIFLAVTKQSGENTLLVVNRVKKKVKELEALMPSNVKIVLGRDNSEIITYAINNLMSTIFYGAIFIILVVFFFLRNIKNTLIIIFTIPFSLIIAFIFMYLNGYTINVLSLMSLAVAIGMVVDSAIVVLENSIRHIEKGEKPSSAAIFATSEVGSAIVASTLTTIIVLLPLLFLTGIIGKLFGQFSILASIVLLGSLFTALTFTPMLVSKLIKREEIINPKHSKLYKLMENTFNTMESFYVKILNWALDHKLLVIIISTLFFIFTLYGIKMVGTEYIPDIDTGDVTVVIKLEPGTRVEKTKKVADKVVGIIERNFKDVENITTIAGQTEQGLLSLAGYEEGTNIATIYLKIKKKSKRTQKYSSEEIAKMLRDSILKEIPGVIDVKATAAVIAQFITGGSKVELRLYGDDIDTLKIYANKIKDLLSDVKGLTSLSTDINEVKKEVRIKVDRKKLELYGINMAMVGLSVRKAIYGEKVGKLKEGNNEYEIRVIYDDKYRRTFNDIKNILIPTLTGRMVHLSEIANIEIGEVPINIIRINQQKVATITGDLDGTLPLGDVKTNIEKKLKTSLFLPKGYRLELAGFFKEQKSTFKNLSFFLLVAIILVYMVMAGQYEAYRDPFIIMFSVPFAASGAFIGFILTGTTISAISFLGIIILVGIVVNNAIVLVDYINLLRKRGYKLYDAVKQTARYRFRPILMTATTTILGSLPMALSRGEGSELWNPLGITIVSGLLVSTMVTLIFVPVLYTIFHRKEE